MGRAANTRTGRGRFGSHRWAGLSLAGGLLAASLFVVARPSAEAAPGGPVHMNPTSWNPTDEHEPFESSGPYVFDSRLPYASLTGTGDRSGVGSFAKACQVVLNTYPPIEPTYMIWRVKVESTDDYYAAAEEANGLSLALDTSHAALTKALSQVPGYDTGVDPIRKYDWNVVILHEMINTGGGQAPLFPDVGIPWDHWDAAWNNLTQSYDEVSAICPH